VTATRRELVLAAVARCFSEAERDRALEILDTYGLEPHERERERVQLAILNLCGGDLGRLKHFVEVAKTDHRDLLFWSE
jgi:hypothetical protein